MTWKYKKETSVHTYSATELNVQKIKIKSSLFCSNKLIYPVTKTNKSIY